VEYLPAAEAVETLVHDYGALVFHLIYSLTGHWQDSQDLAQEVFEQALRAIDAARQARGEAFQARPWLLRIAVNTARMYLRRRRLVRFVAFSDLEQAQAGDEQAGPESWLTQATPVQPPGYSTRETEDPAVLISERDVVARTLAQLPESLRLPLLLSVVAGCSTTEIARILDLSDVAVRQRLSRARKAFHRLYTAEQGEAVTPLPEAEMSATSRHAAGRSQALTLTAAPFS